MRFFWKIIGIILITCIITAFCLIFIPVITAEKPIEEIKQPAILDTSDKIVYGQTLEFVIDNIRMYSLKYLNEERMSANLSQLIEDEILNYIAKRHSESMAIYNYCERLDFDGKYPVDRARDMGFNTKKIYNGVIYDGVGENLCAMPHGGIVVGFGKIDIYDSEKIARSMIKCLMDSPEHKENILNEVYTHVGVGVAYGHGYYYLTQDFW